MLMKGLLVPFLEWAQKLRYPTLFKLTAALFVVTVFVPDPVPLLDEAILALGTMLLANWKRRKEPPPLPPQQNIIESTARKESP